MKQHINALFQYPSFVLSVAGACGVFIGFGSAWATQVSRIDSLEKSIHSAQESFVTKDQLGTIKEMLNSLNTKMDIQFGYLEKMLKK